MSAQPPTRRDRTREKILHAAIGEFSEHGLAGARISAIAQAANVNKALLYYYFTDKEAMYTAALEEVAAKVAGQAMAVLDLDCSAGERMLRFALQHFDRILSQQGFQALMQQEMIRYRLGQSHAMGIIAKRAFEPTFSRVQQIAEEGIRTGELCPVDWTQMLYSALGANVFYFLSAPMMQMMFARDLFDPEEVAARRTSAIQFLGQALFTDRSRGAQIAKSVLAAMPIPEFDRRGVPGTLLAEGGKTAGPRAGGKKKTA